MRKKPTIALMYDFDKTLCDQDMQNYTFIPNLGMTPAELWGKVESYRKKNYMEGILGYLYCSIKMCEEKGIDVTKEYLRSTGEEFHVMCLPDHPTPIEIRTHSMEPVPFFIYRSECAVKGVESLNEDTAIECNNYLPEGTVLMEMLIGHKN